MATRAERFKSDTARKGSKPPSKRANKTARTPSRAKMMGNALPGDERRYGGMSTAARNKQQSPGEASYDLEDTRAPQPPSRKSTRKSSEHVKLGTALTGRQQLKLNSPHNKHDRRGL